MKQEGFGLVELLIVTLIVGFIIVLMANLANPIKLLGISQKESLAKEVVLRQVERLRALGYDSICNPNPGPCTDSIVDLRLNSLPNGSGLITVEACPQTICTNNEETKKVTVKVSWDEGGNTRSVEAATLISQGGLK